MIYSNINYIYMIIGMKNPIFHVKKIIEFMSNESETWVSWLIRQPLGKYFVEIDETYINKAFNFYGLRQKVPNFRQALDLIRGPYVELNKRPPTFLTDIDDYGICLYGLLHVRYLMTETGLEKMYQKYINNDFEKCPRIMCDHIQCLPYGPSDDIGNSSVKMFCPCCHDIYHSKDKEVNVMDGAFFGPSWVHLFLAKYPNIVPKGPLKKYTPRIFGFRICSPDDIKDMEEEEED